MRRRKKVPVLLLAAAAIAATIPANAVAAPNLWPSGTGTGSSARTSQANPRSATLITGDRVTVAGDGEVSIMRGKDRANVTFLIRKIRGHLHVVPSDAQQLLRADRLDARLFDVTLLLESGYDDRRADLPLIVTHAENDVFGAKGRVASSGAKVVRDLPSINALAVRAQRDNALWKSLSGTTSRATLAAGVSKVWLDGLRKPVLDESVPQIGAPAAWAAGYTGAGVTVAVLDTGIDATHPDLVGRVAAQANFTEGEEADPDIIGHGTHVGSTIAGTGAGSNGQFKGVAPGARLAAGKVCAGFGCAESWILAGMQWAAADQHAKVVNMSLGGFDTPEVDPLEAAVESLTAQYGTLFVIAAGNSGDDETVGSPASADAALAVGAVTKQDDLAVFSSRGPRVGDAALKPDITAPGQEITAARSKDADIGSPGDLYFTASGTSMATPHVAGAAAILAQRRPDWTAAQLKAALMASAKPNPEIGVFGQGAGRVDVARAINQAVTTSPTSVSYGRQIWPHNDDPVLTRQVTYHNSGSAAVTLQLALHASGPNGAAAPGGLFRVGATSVTVPAGGSATVDLVADTRVAGPDGYYGGHLTATGGDQIVQTPFAVDKEVESYNVTLRSLDRAGQPAEFADIALIRMDQFDFRFAYDPSGTVTVRLPKGRYTVDNLVFKFDDNGPTELTQLVYPGLEVTGPLTIVMDARVGKPVSVSVPNRDAQLIMLTVSTSITTPEGSAGGVLLAGEQEGLFLAQVGGDRRVEGFQSSIGSTWAGLDAGGTPNNSPYGYFLTWYQDGRFYTGFTKRVEQRDLATVQSSYGAHIPGANGERVVFGLPPNFGVVVGSVLPFELPFRRTEYYNEQAGLEWFGFFNDTLPGEPFRQRLTFVEGPLTAYRSGRTYHEQWNRGVFGPCLPERQFPVPWVGRLGDMIFVDTPWHCDAAGRAGYATAATARTTLFRDGVKVGETALDGFGQFEVPAGAGRYRLETEMTVGAPFVLGSRRLHVWEFNSAHVAGEEPAALALSAVALTPPLNERNTAPAGIPYAIGVGVNPQLDSPAGANRSVTVDVSYDDGRTWQPAPVIKLFGARFALVHHPNADGFVSLRTKAVDVHGNSVEQTTIRAYRIAR